MDSEAQWVEAPRCCCPYSSR